ncbi:uncharacterized protein [Salvelinus alpinus]|uniref:uncharacterized protein n=1 Tax=Salvelinus alpinus TaxID=8036 RepID=UPI0039FCFFD3
MADVHHSFWELLVTVLYLLTGVSGETLSMFSREGDDVRLPCNNVVNLNCSSTTWTYIRDGSTGTTEEVAFGKIKVEKTERAGRLSVGSDCSLHVSDVRAEDAGLYTCRQFLTETGPQHGEDAPVRLSVLTSTSNAVKLPISHIMLFVTLTIMAAIVTIHTRRNRPPKALPPQAGVSGETMFSRSSMADRLSVGSECSLNVSDVRAEDAGLYICQQFLTETGPQQGEDAHVLLSVLTISSTPPVTDLKPNVNMTLRCSLLTYKGHGRCNSGVSLSWVPKTGTNVQVTQRSPCDITLTVTLQREDNNRKWTCTLTEEGNVKISIDFTSTFSGTSNVVKLPISRIMLFVTLTIMAAMVTIHTRRNRPPKALPPQAEEASGIEVHVLEE